MKKKSFPKVDSVLHAAVRESPKLSASTRDKYLRDLNGWCAFAGTDPAYWNPRGAQAWYNSMLQRGVKPQSATRALASLQYASGRLAVLDNNPTADFARNTETAKPDGEKPKNWFSPAQAIAMLEACKDGTPAGLRDFAMFVVMLETGMRRMSLCSMHLETTAALRRTNGLAYTKVLLKGRNGLFDVPLSDTAMTAIAPWRQWLAKSTAASGPVFRRVARSSFNAFAESAGREAISREAITYIVAERGEKAGIPDAHPHMFRHTFSTWRTEAGYSPVEIAAMTGHKLKDIGALATYINLDSPEIRERIRMSTPSFLREYVGG